jgi:hypothetical protein
MSTLPNYAPDNLSIKFMPDPDIKYDLGQYLQPSPSTRPLFTDHFYKCLPLTSANTAGWTLYNPFEFTVQWKNGPLQENVIIECAQEKWVRSWFGFATFTIHPQFIVKTSPGINLWVRPVPNTYKPPILGLEGMVETDWLRASFTINYMIRMPLVKTTYKVGEPLVQFVPYPREFIEHFDPEIVEAGEEYEEVMAFYRQWQTMRKENIEQRGPADLHYMRGLDIDGTKRPEHKRAFKLSPFRRRMSRPQAGSVEVAPAAATSDGSPDAS